MKRLQELHWQIVLASVLALFGLICSEWIIWIYETLDAGVEFWFSVSTIFTIRRCTDCPFVSRWYWPLRSTIGRIASRTIGFYLSVRQSLSTGLGLGNVLNWSWTQ